MCGQQRVRVLGCRKEEDAMTVHARQLARQCRERMVACDEESPDQRQPEQATTATPSEETKPMSREEALQA
ncbi:hypothetical protein GCM10027436_27080 [Actinophytocola sediminis]